jgi:hypothetical protein
MKPLGKVLFAVFMLLVTFSVAYKITCRRTHSRMEQEISNLRAATLREVPLGSSRSDVKMFFSRHGIPLNEDDDTSPAAVTSGPSRISGFTATSTAWCVNDLACGGVTVVWIEVELDRAGKVTSRKVRLDRDCI